MARIVSRDGKDFCLDCNEYIENIREHIETHHADPNQTQANSRIDRPASRVGSQTRITSFEKKMKQILSTRRLLQIT